jgi:hypothetical protein
LRKARSVSGDRRQCAGPISVHSRESGNPGAEKLDQRSRFRASARIFELYANAACGWAERCHSVPSPHVGEGQGYNRHGIFCYRRPTNAAPSVLASWVFAQEYLCARCFIATPLPVPPPHGGREPCGTRLRNSLLRSLRYVHALALPRGRTELTGDSNSSHLALVSRRHTFGLWHEVRSSGLSLVRHPNLRPRISRHLWPDRHACKHCDASPPDRAIALLSMPRHCLRRAQRESAARGGWTWK